MIRTSVVNNPELLRLASIDLRHGIPGDVFYGADERTRAWLRDEHVRQRGAYLRERTDADSRRKQAAHRLLARPGRVETPGDQLRHLQTLLLEISAFAGRLANALPNVAPDRTEGDAPAQPSQEMPS